MNLVISGIYRRKTKQPPYSRTCWHWAHIKRRHGLVAKLGYLIKRKLGIKSPVFGQDLCYHISDGQGWHYIPMGNTLTNISTSDDSRADMSEYKSWLDKYVCVEIYRHQLNNQELCGDCQNYWNSWSGSQRIIAKRVGRSEHNRRQKPNQW